MTRLIISQCLTPCSTNSNYGTFKIAFRPLHSSIALNVKSYLQAAITCSHVIGLLNLDYKAKPESFKYKKKSSPLPSDFAYSYILFNRFTSSCSRHTYLPFCCLKNNDRISHCCLVRAHID